NRFPVRVEENPTYSCWSGYKEYPQFNFENPEVKAYLIQVARFWIEKFKIDGWRLDSCSDIPYSFVTEFAQASRALKPDMMIIGENWHSDYEMMHHGVDGITNYGLYWDAVIPFLGSKGKMSSFAGDLMEHIFKSSPYYEQYSWNFLNNHDIARFQSVVNSESQYLIALTLMFLLPGTPVLYYGEEIGLPGLQDPDNRRCMDWETVAGNSVLEYVKDLVALRKSHLELLNNGILSIPYLNEQSEVMVICRQSEDKALFAVFNFSKADQNIEINEVLKGQQLTTLMGEEILSGQGLNLSPLSSSIFLSR
ncbi:MAG: alpha-amylase family glycosyl hydrolase, partial [Bacteroidota bacterium]